MSEKHTMHVTMPRDKALEYLESLEKLVNDQFADMGYVVALGMAVREFRAAEQDNAPLTLEQLRGMDGEPVRIDDDEAIFYGLVSLSGNCFTHDEIITLSSGDFYLLDNIGEFKFYQCRPPEKGE